MLQRPKNVDSHLWYLLVFLLIFFACACSNSEPIRIAFIGALSGETSEVAVSVRNAVSMKVEAINRSGGIKGKKIALDFFDNEGDPLKCREKFNEIFEKRYKIIFGPIFSQMAQTMSTAIQGKDVLVLSPTMSTDVLSDLDDNFIRTVFPTSGQAKLLARYAIEKKIKTVAVVYDLGNAKYTESLYNIFRKEAAGISFPIVKAVHMEKRPKMFQLAQSIQDVQADAVLMCLSAIDAANLAQQLKKAGSTSQLLGISWSQTNDLLEHGGRAVEGMVLISVLKNDNKTPQLIAFEKAYENRYHQKPSFPSMLGYDAINVLIEGIKTSDAKTPQTIKKAILTQSKFDGIAYPIQINQFGDSIGNFSLVKVQDNLFSPLN